MSKQNKQYDAEGIMQDGTVMRRYWKGNIPVWERVKND